MNDAEFIVACAAWEKAIPFSKAGDYNAARVRLREAASPEHAPRIEEVSYMSDQCLCACGWKSNRFFDGAEYAEDEWRKHVHDEVSGDFPSDE